MYQLIDGPNVYGTINVTTTPVELKVGASALDERKMMIIQSMGNRIYIGYNASVTSANGIELSKRQIIFLEAGPAITVYAVASAGSIDVRIQELS